MSDMDPLSSYDYSYNYEQMQNNYMYNVKIEPFQRPTQPVNLPLYSGLYPVDFPVNDKSVREGPLVAPLLSEQNNIPIESSTEQVDSKENIMLITEPKRRWKKKGKTSSYWNKKIEDKNFPFYGCAICNVSFPTIQELDQHVTIHKGRITSYDIRVRNQLKRKQRMKEIKKLKKLKKLGKKVKLEPPRLEVEIKPEDGYIGNEIATLYKSSNNDCVSTDLQSLNTEDSIIGNEGPEINDAQNKESGNNDTIHSETKPDNNEKTSAAHANNDDKIVNEAPKTAEVPITVPVDPRLQKLFKCFACQKQFSLSYYLKLHVRSHTDEKPYTCAQCGQSFITASKLGRHNKRIHLAVRFQCRICYRYFSRFDILTRHFDKAHKEEKLEGEPYDYNAILPYLKELEEQLKEKDVKPETQPKTEEPGESWFGHNVDDQDAMDNKDQMEMRMGHVIFGDNPYLKIDKEEEPMKGTTAPLENVIVEEVKCPEEDVTFEIKIEEEDHEEESVKDDKDDGMSDDDYFPTNTWAATPKIEINPSPPPLPKKVKSSDFPMKCQICDKVINTPSYYKVHLRTHTGERPYICFICDRGFITSSKMHRHVLTHPDYWKNGGEDKIKLENEVKAEVDNNINVENKGTKKRRNKKTQTKTQNKVKEECKKRSKEDLVKEEDIKSDTEEGNQEEKKSDGEDTKEEKDVVSKRKYQKRPHACLYCNKRFLHLQTLQVHKKSHEGEDLVLKCMYCLEVLPDVDALKAHEAMHDGPRPYVCTICGRTYTKKETMIYHRKSHDSNSKTGERRSEYICDICSKTFNAQCKLQRHLVSHRVDKFVLRYECPVCAHMFNTKYHVQMHLATHQKEGLILEENRNEILAMVLQNARKIPKKADTSVNLTDLIPSDERSRVCNICGQVFQHFYYLEEHLKSHGSKIAIEDENKPEEKKHVCPICHKGFKLHYYLKLHSFTHTKVKPFICQQCGKGFITKGKLKRHLETHSGLKKYQCHICYKFFTRPSYLRIHVRTIHGTQDYNFRLGHKEFLPIGMGIE